jgi:hypothetical protein
MEIPGIEYTDKQRWFALIKINTLSALSQIVQIGTVGMRIRHGVCTSRSQQVCCPPLTDEMQKKERP